MRHSLASISVISTLLCGDVSQAMNVDEWFAAAEQGDVAKMRSIINDGIDINIRDLWRNTALMKAAENGHIGIVKMLLDREDIDTTDRWGNPALARAAGYGHIGIVKMLLDREDEKYQRKILGLLHIWKNKDKVDNKTLEQYLISDLENLQSSCVSTALVAAAGAGRIEIVKLLLDRGADINKKDGWPLMAALYNGHTEIVKLLLDRGTDINKEDDAPVVVASDKGHTEIVKLLLDEGFNVNPPLYAFVRTALMEATQKEHLEIVKLLLENGADVNLQDGSGLTALMNAVGDLSTGAQFIVWLLIYGADAGMYDFDNATVKDFAEGPEYTDIISPWMLSDAKTDAESLNLLTNCKVMKNILENCPTRKDPRESNDYWWNRIETYWRNCIEECISELEKEISKLSVN